MMQIKDPLKRQFAAAVHHIRNMPNKAERERLMVFISGVTAGASMRDDANKRGQGQGERKEA